MDTEIQWGGIAVVQETGSIGQFIVRAMHITPLFSVHRCIVGNGEEMLCIPSA